VNGNRVSVNRGVLKVIVKFSTSHQR
jgi:hypothetical protein